MDLKDLTPKEFTVDVPIVHPVSGEPLVNDDGSEMTITMYAPYSKEYKAVLHSQTNKRLKNRDKEITAEGIEESTLELLAQTTKSWNITFDGEQPKCTASKAKDIYTEVFWIRNQLEAGVDKTLDFISE